MTGDGNGGPAAPDADKAVLRRSAIAQRQAMGDDERVRFDQAIFERLIALREIDTARTLMAFVSIRGEVDTRRLLRHWLDEGRRLCVPKTEPATRRMSAVAIEDLDRDLAPGVYGVPEPPADRGQVVALDEIDAVLVPALLFDRRGLRIGYGAGYYDRFIERLPASTALIGLAYGWQVRDRIPSDPWDKPVGLIVTENGAVSPPTGADGQ